MLQNSPTSTTPVMSLILFSSWIYQPRQSKARVQLTSAGFFIQSSPNGASMIKLPLSLTTGPAFFTPILSANPGLPFAKVAGDPMRDRLVSTVAYANGTTSIGIPCVHCGISYSPARKVYELTVVPSTFEFFR